MRNLQKILALALALIMSFSLVVTANAAFSDEADISEAYNESVDVLSTLEVFKGYTDGTYQPQKSITRAEVAAIIYRIATGDVADEQVAIYSDWNRFTDVHAGEWWAGYINYCANAEYIKGYGNGKFGPDDPVTGYEALAMILRAVGYGKMDGEFQGSDWAVQTAARANGLKVTRNVQNSALLNSAATRELVAELLCKAMLVPTVEYNQYNGYTENDESLAKKNFGLEKIEGVVMANEYADLEDDDETLADGKTRLQMGDRAVTLNVTSTLDDIGETRYAYVKPTRNNDYDMVCSALFEEEGMNVVGETGAETKTKDLIKDTGLKDNGEKTLHYRNFDLANADYTSDWRLEFEVTFWNQLNDAGDTIVKSASNVKKDFEKDYADGYILQETKDTSVNSVGMKDESPAPTPAIDKAQLKYTMVIKANDEITEQQLGVIRGIFAMADDDTHSLNVTGAVYAGSKSTDNNKGSSSSNNNRWNDLSDEMSYRTFYNEYISSKLTKIEGTTNGNTLKVIDNNNDGYVEYVLYTHYVLDEVVDSTTKGDKTTFYWDHLDTDDYEPAYIGEYEPTVGDIVIYAEIDGKAQMKLADSENATINAISYKDVSATSTEGKTYEQSDITNGTDMDELITAMDEKVEYVLYLDNYGYVRAYKLAQGNKYGLITELYPTRSNNSAYVKNTDLTVELMTADDNSPKEYDVDNSKNNAMAVSSKNDAWETPGTNSRYDELNYLERAQAHLGLRPSDLFDYKPDATPKDVDNYSYTNVAKYIMTDDGVNIYTAAEYSYNKEGKQLYYETNAAGEIIDTKNKTTTETSRPVYAVDYVQLEVKDIEKGARRFDIDPSYNSTIGSSNEYVNAVDDTHYYLVMADSGVIKHIVGRANLPELKVNENKIRAMYAVAGNTTADKAERDYWVADVIVIELETLSNSYESVSLAFYNFQKYSDQVKYLNTLNNEHTGVELDVIPDGESWQWQWNNYGFYGLRGTENTDEDNTVEAELIGLGRSKDNSKPTSRDLTYNGNGIYAGEVVRVVEVTTRGGYVVVNLLDENDKVKGVEEIFINNDILYAIDEDGSVNKAVDIRILEKSSETDVKTNDKIIWVNDSDDKCAFVVDLTDIDGTVERRWDTPSWLWAEYNAILAEQTDKTDTTSVTFFGAHDKVGSATTADGKDTNAAEHEITVSYADAKAWNKTVITIPEGATAVVVDTATSKVVALKDVAFNPKGTAYTVYITDKNDNQVEWTMVQESGRADNNLYATWLVGVTDTEGKFTAVNQDYKGSEITTVENFLKTLTTKNGATITKATFVDGNGKDLPTTNTALSAVGYAKIVVTAENGDSQEYRINIGTNVIVNGPFASLKNVLENTGLKLDIYQRGTTFFSSANDAYHNTNNDGWTVSPSANGVAYDEAVAVMNALNAWLDTYNNGEFKDEFSVTLDSMNDDGNGPNANVTTNSTSGVAGHDGCKTEKTKSNVRICDTFGNEVTTIRVSVTWVTTICEPTDKAAKDAAAELESNVFEIFVKTANKETTPSNANAIYYASEADLNADTTGTAGKTLYALLAELANDELPSPYLLVGTAVGSFDPHGAGGTDEAARSVTTCTAGDPTGAEFKFQVDMAYTDENGATQYTAMGSGADKFAPDPFIFWKVTAK